MPEVQRRLILANGEKYVKPVEKSHAGRPPEYPRSYEAARDLMKREVSTALDQFNELPSRKRMKNEAVFCLRLHPDMTAKSYDPQFIFAEVPELENVGSRNYRVAAGEIARTARVKRQLEKEITEVTGRLVFVRSSDAGFRRLLTVLDQSERSLTDAFRKEIQTFEKFNMLSQEEQLSAFAQDYADWQEGRVEIVLHPSRHSELAQTHFLKELFRDAGILTKVTQNSGPNGILTPPDLHKLAEGLFLSAWTHWEQFTHSLLIEDLATTPTSKLNRGVSAFRTTGAARRLANQLLTHPDHPQKFIEWSDYGSVVSRANEFLGAGNRFAVTPLPRRGDLELLKRVRNAVAHRSDKAWNSFLALCRDQPFATPPAQMRGITPGRFLVSHNWNGRSVIRDTISLLDGAAKHLVP